MLDAALIAAALLTIQSSTLYLPRSMYRQIRPTDQTDTVNGQPSPDQRTDTGTFCSFRARMITPPAARTPFGGTNARFGGWADLQWEIHNWLKLDRIMPGMNMLPDRVGSQARHVEIDRQTRALRTGHRDDVPQWDVLVPDLRFKHFVSFECRLDLTEAVFGAA